MPETTVGTPHINTKRVKMPDTFEGELETGQPYEIVLKNVSLRIPELGVGGGPAFDAVAEWSGKIYDYITSEGHEYPHYFYARFSNPVPVMLDGGEYEQTIYEMRIQFIARSPFAITLSFLIGLAILLGIVILSAGFVWFVLRPAGEFLGGGGGVIIVIVALILLFLFAGGSFGRAKEG